MSKKLGIKAISNSCGILPHTLRIWEKRYSMFSPERTPGGQRLYGEEDLEKAKYLARLIEQGHGISQLSQYSLGELEQMATSLGSELKPANSQVRSSDFKGLLLLLKNYKLDLISNELQRLRVNLGAKQFIFQVVLPTMQEIGLMVAKGKYTVSQEHIISVLIREQLAHIALPEARNRDNEIILATPENNLHELSILIANVLCGVNGVATRYLGASHPPECLAEAVNALKSPYMVLGVVTSDGWDYETEIKKYLTKIDNKLKKNVTVILGGAKKLEFPQYKFIEEVIIINTLELFDQFLAKLT